MAAGMIASGALALDGCASQGRCGLIACGVQATDLLKVSAEQLSSPAAELKVYDIRNYPEATVTWRISKSGRQYQCREKRDDVAPDHVHFVYCRPAT